MARVLITGCSKGIGRATAIELARRGHEVVATARRAETLADLPVAVRLALDVTDDASVKRAADAAGAIDVLVNNAAEIALGPLESLPLGEARRLFDINLFGALRTVQAFAPAMRARGKGTIVNVSSMVGRMGFPLTGAYVATKWALEGLSESLRFELGHFGVHVVLVEPGAISSGALDAPRSYFASDDPYLPLAGQLKFDPSRMTAPEAVARAISDASERPERQFRWVIGPDAEALLGARAKQDDASFEETFRDGLGLKW
jgi:NAD(P)-dependent dehydrogenase (short-subunit alcohol dehydrogenase family)